MFSGTKIKLNGRDVVVPPISLGQLRNGTLERLHEHDQLVAAGKTFEAIQLRGEILLEALRRNYPDFSEDEFFSYLDMGNIGPLWLSIISGSGFLPGEVQAALTALSGTSDQSTEASPPPTDGLIAK